MRAALFAGQREVQVADVDDPILRHPDDVIVRLVRSAICGSDKGLYLNPGAKPGVHGHEGAGVVVEVGSGVRHRRPGDRVVIYDVIGCGACGYCRQGQFTYCPDRQGSVSGAFGELVVAPERNLIPLPDGLPFDRACLLSDAFGTPAKGVRKLGVGPADTVAVFGCGPIGLNAVQIAKAYGARVIACDLVDYRLEAARKLGALHVINVSKTDPVASIREQAEGGATKSIDATGDPAAERQAIGCLRPAGRALFLGECGKLEISPSQDLIRRDLEIMGSWYIHLDDFPANLALMADTSADPLRIVTHRLALDDIATGFDLFCDHRDGCLKVVVTMTEE